MSDDPPDVPIAQPAALEYARPLQPGEVPDYLPEVEAAIHCDASIHDVCRPFHGVSEAAAYLQKSIARRFGTDRLGPGCAACGAPTYGLLVVTWSFTARKGWLERGEGRGVTTTRHRVCFTCDRALRRGQARRQSRQTVAVLLCCAGVATYMASTKNAFGGRLAEVELGAVVTAIVAFAWSCFAWFGQPPIAPDAVRVTLPSWLTPQFADAWREYVTAEERLAR